MSHGFVILALMGPGFATRIGCQQTASVGISLAALTKKFKTQAVLKFIQAL